MVRKNPQQKASDVVAQSRGAAAPADIPPSPEAEREHTLESLVPLLGSVDEGLREALFAVANEEALVERGTQVDSIHILNDMPRFLGGAYDILSGMRQDQRDKLLISLPVLGLCLDETLVLRGLYGEHLALETASASGRAGRDVEAREEMREGVALRDNVVGGLRNTLSEKQMAELEALVGTAESSEALRSGLENVAGYVAHLLENGSERDRMRLGAFGISAARVEALRAKAAQVRAAGKVTVATARQVSQRRLDLQDGRVLFLVERILRAFRSARREDRTILVPLLRALAWMFDTGAGRSRRSDNGERAPRPTAPTTPAA